MSAEIGTAYVKIEPTAKGISGKIEKELGGTGKSSGQAFNTGFASVIGGTAKVLAGATAAGATAIGAITKQATESYAEFEQLEGGAKLLFGDAFDTVINNADNAFKNVQMSTNDYLKTANGYATGLKEALGGDAEAAAELTDKIITAQADVVAATGNSAENVSNAFAGIMRNNFTMLDNLQIGIKPTQEGMQELIDKMNELNGTKYEFGNLADMQSALVDYIEYVGMAGYANMEASQTIQGSLASMKASWQDLLTGMATDGADMSKLIDNFVSSASSFVGNIQPVVQQALTGITQLIGEIAPIIATELPAMISSILPSLLSSGIQVVEALAQGILQAAPSLLPMLLEIAVNFVNTFSTILPQILQVGISLIQQLAQGITQAIPTLVPILTNLVLELVTILTNPETFTQLLQSGIDMILALADGIISAIPQLVAQLPQIIQNIVDALTTGLPVLIEGAIALMNALVAALPQITQALVAAAPQIVESLATGIIQAAPLLLSVAPMLTLELVKGLIQNMPQMLTAGGELVKGVIQGLASAYATLSAEGPKMISGLLSRIKSEIRKFIEVGKNLVQFIIDGIKSFASNLYAKGVELMNGLKSKIADAAKGFASIGKSIIEGIKDGIANAWGDLVAWFKEKVASLKINVKDLVTGGEKEEQKESTTKSDAIASTANSLSGSSSDMVARYQATSNNSDSETAALLKQYLPVIASKNEVNVSLEGSTDRLFRVMQSEQRRYNELVGVNA